jgi:hypothetical protein
MVVAADAKRIPKIDGKVDWVASVALAARRLFAVARHFFRGLARAQIGLSDRPALPRIVGSNGASDAYSTYWRLPHPGCQAP